MITIFLFYCYFFKLTISNDFFVTNKNLINIKFNLQTFLKYSEFSQTFCVIKVNYYQIYFFTFTIKICLRSVACNYID